MPLLPMMNCGKKVRLKPTKTSSGRDPAPLLAVHPAGDLRPPVVQPAEEGDHRAADHHVVEVGHDEVGVVQVDVDGQRAEEQARQSADAEQEDERQGVAHRRLERDRALVHRGQPVEDLDRRGNRDAEGQEAEDHVGQGRLAAGEHVVAPDQEADHRDGDRAVGDEPVAEDVPAAEGRDQLAHDAHRRQDHDVDGRVGVEPEEVLEEDRVAAEGRIEDADAEGCARRSAAAA